MVYRSGGRSLMHNQPPHDRTCRPDYPVSWSIFWAIAPLIFNIRAGAIACG
ncbi:MAG: hypothetical protein NW220_09740 [Leptolyngbyaceae cyanobacterium bins.349]|nr:hypothetical protein [Leptolyngbyaceae cyanobacterium bins.349]